jgi:acetate kinase
VRVLVVNTGSSSLKLSVLEAGRPVAARTVERWQGEDDLDEVRAFLDEVGSVDAIGHRVVHGGAAHDGPARVDDALLAELAALTDLAPLHQPRALAALAATGRLLPGVPAVACFDTAFHRTLSVAAATYALPAAWNDRWGLRRYGFHGLSHAYAARRGAELVDRPVLGLRVLSCHLGAGASLCAVRDGRSVDTTMGFTPLAGLVMATRSGSVDPGMLLWLLSADRLSVDEVTDALEHGSGLAGLSGTSGDLRDVRLARDAGSVAAALAYDVFVHRLVREAGAMVAGCGGLDLLVLTGGIGEHAPDVRGALAEGLAHLGVRIDPAANAAARGDAVLSPPGAEVGVAVVTAGEDREIAREVAALLA